MAPVGGSSWVQLHSISNEAPAGSVRFGSARFGSVWWKRDKATFQRKRPPNLLKVSRPQQLICVGSADEHARKVAKNSPGRRTCTERAVPPFLASLLRPAAPFLLSLL